MIQIVMSRLQIHWTSMLGWCLRRTWYYVTLVITMIWGVVYKLDREDPLLVARGLRGRAYL